MKLFSTDSSSPIVELPKVTLKRIHGKNQFWRFECEYRVKTSSIDHFDFFGMSKSGCKGERNGFSLKLFQLANCSKAVMMAEIKPLVMEKN